VQHTIHDVQAHLVERHRSTGARGQDDLNTARGTAVKPPSDTSRTTDASRRKQ
jgi:hypothetical protein